MGRVDCEKHDRNSGSRWAVIGGLVELREPPDLCVENLQVMANFNMLPSTVVMSALLCVIGVGPMAVRVIANRKYPEREDRFQQMINFLPEYQESFEGVFHTGRTDPDAAWKDAHGTLGNLTR